MPETARERDSNGWIEIKDNPISKAGVFPYLGSMCDSTGALGLDPDTVYQVYRAAEELSNYETIESFKLIPWVDEHTILGNDSLQLTPAEEKGIGGVIGENVYFDDGTLFGNLKMFSGDLETKVAEGKKELSCGFRCKYSLQSGVFGDQQYDLVQTHIRGNHLASVEAGRMGPEVAVLDHHLTFTIDSKDFAAMPDEKEDKAEDEMKDDETKAEDTYNDEDDKKSGMDMDDDKDKDEKSGMDDRDEDSDLATAGDEDEDDDEKGEDSSVALDALDRVKTLEKALRKHQRTGVKSFMRQLRQRDALYSKASEFIGAFDHADMTTDELATYACDKLGMKPPKGHEVTALESYFHDRRPTQAVFTSRTIVGVALDSKTNSKAIDKYFAGTSGLAN